MLESMVQKGMEKIRQYHRVLSLKLRKLKKLLKKVKKKVDEGREIV